MAILGVLRRPQTKADLNPRILKTLDLVFSSQPRDGWRGTPIRALIRLATRTPWGAYVYLVPMRPPTDSQLGDTSPPCRQRRELA